MTTQEVTQATKRRASSLLDRVANLIDRVVPPETRRELWKNSSNFASEQPLLASFLAVQIALSALPFLLFVTFAVLTLVLSVVAALAFSVFWIGVAVLILVPTLLTLLFAGVFVWIWAIGTYLFCRFAYRMAFIRTEQYTPSKSDMKSVLDGGSSTSNGQAALGVPDVVKKSIRQAHESFEAATNSDAVEEKKAVENELLHEYPPEDSKGRQNPHQNGIVNSTVQRGDRDGYSDAYSKSNDYATPEPRRFMPGEATF